MISVIIPTYKNPEMLDLCLKSAIEGQNKDNQIIVVVDGHYDINEHVLNKWCHTIEVLNLETNVGLCKATNLGVYNAKHEHILIVNDDNVFPYGWDLNLTASFEASGGVLSPNQIEPTPSMFSQFHIKDLGKTIEDFNLREFWEYEIDLSEQKLENNGSTLPIFMSKVDYLRVGGWDENYDLGMVADWDFFLKCQVSGLKLQRTYLSHFYHFASASTNGLKRQQAEQLGHEYAKYKWGSYIKHNPENNIKYI
jgi:glycosyltransferase involved in cell wall biosynthesis